MHLYRAETFGRLIVFPCLITMNSAGFCGIVSSSQTSSDLCDITLCILTAVLSSNGGYETCKWRRLSSHTVKTNVA